MLVSETDVERALDVFLREAQIPRHAMWSKKWEARVMQLRIIPAFLKALEAIEPVDYCYGFDASKIDVEQYRREKMER